MGELGPLDGMTMKRNFCAELVKECQDQVEFPDYDGVTYCEKHAGRGSADLNSSYPLTSTGTRQYPGMPRHRANVEWCVTVRLYVGGTNSIKDFACRSKQALACVRPHCSRGPWKEQGIKAIFLVFASALDLFWRAG